MPRTLGKLSLNGQFLTAEIPVRCRTELGMFTGHLDLPEGIIVELRNGDYALHLKDGRNIAIAFSGICDSLAYFRSVTSNIEQRVPVMA